MCPSFSKKGLSLAADKSPDLVLVDFNLPDISGLKILQELKSQGTDLMVIALTGYTTIDDAVKAMNFGACDYLQKPLDSKRLKESIKNALELHGVSRELTEVKGPKTPKTKFGEIIGTSTPMREIYKMIEAISSRDITVLIRGESGTGKELVAREIHKRSKRKNGPLQAVDCATLPEHLAESELFGYEEGAFTGAVKRKKGKFELANTGSLFLDEIGNVPLNVQVKLLRVLEERKLERLGGKEALEIDVRIIAATNSDLEKALAHASFRKDLYYRLNVFSIELPLLREREEDILLLAYHFMERFNRKFDKRVLGISSKAEETLENYHWPGNVRELKNAIQRAVILAGDTILLEHFPSAIHEYERENLSSKSNSLDERLERLEKKYLKEAITKAGGSLTKAAKMSDISFRSMRYRVKKYNLKDQIGGLRLRGFYENIGSKQED